LKSVNHRGLDIHFRMAAELDPFEGALRAAIKRHVTRGHVQVQMRYTNTRDTAPAEINQPLLDKYLTAFHRLSAVHGLRGQPDLNLAFQMPGMFLEAEEEPDSQTESLLVGAIEEALERLNDFRAREGAEIAADMRARNGAVLRCARQMEELRAAALPEFQARLEERLAELLRGVDLEPQRLAQEVAYLADRSDISEELTRLKVHAVQLDDLLHAGGEIGKKLDFLLQEMHRETNTVLSKSTGVGEAGLEITDLALTVKAEIEKIREQGLNLE
jgi:uncharacterized protein (TIGR00255 family)